MKTRILLVLAIACIFSGGLFAQTQADDPVSLVENLTGKIFADVTENLDEYWVVREEVSEMTKSMNLLTV